jgi:EAL domain-containing protein (putative c-di-GMP-specific phosphodiesterase class I)
VSGIITLAHSLGFTALAEGVETPEQAEVLRQLGCDLAQGYLWTPALAPLEFEAWLVGGEPAHS